MEFKLLSYNIMSGCFEDYTPNSKLTDRFDLLKGVVKQIAFLKNTKKKIL